MTHQNAARNIQRIQQIALHTCQLAQAVVAPRFRRAAVTGQIHGDCAVATHLQPGGHGIPCGGRRADAVEKYDGSVARTAIPIGDVPTVDRNRGHLCCHAFHHAPAVGSHANGTALG